MINVKMTYKNVPQFTTAEYTAYRKTIKDTCESWALGTENKVKLDLTGKLLKVKTGRLRNSIKHKVTQTQAITKIEIGSWSVPYAEIHDKKGNTIITPKNVSFLTIPVSPNITGRARQYANTKVLKIMNRLFLVQIQKRGRIKPLFSLQKQVMLRGVGYLTDNVEFRKPLLELELKNNISNYLNITMNKRT